MLSPEQIETVFGRLEKMSREEMMEHFHHLDAGFPIDLTQEYLDQQSDEHLRHILTAICLECGRMPKVPRPRNAA